MGLLRAVSGINSKKIFDLLERKQIEYIISARMQQSIRIEIGASLNWIPVPKSEGINAAEIQYQAAKWSKPLRMVVIRQSIILNPNAVGKLFGDLPAYRNSTLFTCLRLPALEVWRLYRGRAVAENRIKELK